MIFLETGNQFLGTERVSKLMRQYAVPCIISLLVGALYNIVAQIFIANASYLGSYGNAANTVVFPLTVVALAIAVMVGDGCCAFVSMALGRNEVDKAKRSVGNAVVLSVASSLVLTAVYLMFANTIIAMFGGTVNEETFRHSQEYFFYITLGIPFYMFGQAMNPIIRADGNPKFAMISTLAGAVINIILDPIFIFGFNMGVKGAALGTVLSQACSAAWVLPFLFSKRASLPLEKPYMKLDRKIILSILALGVSPFIMASTESLVGFVLNSSLKEFGDIYISALTILQSAMQFASVPLTGFAQGFVPIISYNYGHGDKQRVKECFRIVLITMFSFNLLLMLFMILFPSTVASAFTSDERLIETVRWTMPVFLGGMTIFGLQRACQNMFVALGQARISIFIALLRKAILLIPLALILPHFMGVTGVYAAEAISDATAAICCTLLFFWQFPKILGKIQGNTLRTS